MTGRFHGANGVTQLLKVARNEAESLRIDLADVERARAATETALSELSGAVEQEEAGSADVFAFNAYSEAMRERRFNLRKTLASLEDAAEAAREKLQASLVEIAKLEHVVEANARSVAADHRRREARKEAEQPVIRAS